MVLRDDSYILLDDGLTLGELSFQRIKAYVEELRLFWGGRIYQIALDMAAAVVDEMSAAAR